MLTHEENELLSRVGPGTPAGELLRRYWYPLAFAQTLTEVQAQQGFAILLVEHDVDLVSSFTTRSYVLDFGKVIAEGPTGEVLRNEEVRAAYLGDVPEGAR